MWSDGLQLCDKSARLLWVTDDSDGVLVFIKILYFQIAKAYFTSKDGHGRRFLKLAIFVASVYRLHLCKQYPRPVTNGCIVPSELLSEVMVNWKWCQSSHLRYTSLSQYKGHLCTMIIILMNVII